MVDYIRQLDTKMCKDLTVSVAVPIALTSKYSN